MYIQFIWYLLVYSPPTFLLLRSHGMCILCPPCTLILLLIRFFLIVFVCETTTTKKSTTVLQSVGYGNCCCRINIIHAKDWPARVKCNHKTTTVTVTKTTITKTWQGRQQKPLIINVSYIQLKNNNIHNITETRGFKNNAPHEYEYILKIILSLRPN